MVKNIIIVGGQRCGSTMLYSNMINASNALAAVQKKGEPKFFVNAASDGSLKAYHDAVFDNYSDDMVLIEKSTSYYENSEALRKIRDTLPNCSIVLIMRDPIKRAVSNYNFSVDNGLERRPLAEALISSHAAVYDPKISVSPFSYKERGLYSQYITLLYETFDKSQVHIVVLEELIKSPDLFFRLAEDLGLEHRKKFISGLNRNSSSEKITKIDPETRAYLIKYFKPDVLRVFNLIGRNIDRWEYIAGGVAP